MQIHLKRLLKHRLTYEMIPVFIPYTFIPYIMYTRVSDKRKDIAKFV